MKNYLSVIKKSPLFGGIEENEIEPMLSCLAAETKTYRKGEFVFRFGDRVDSIGLVLSGGVDVVTEDYWGNRNIVAAAGPGQTFAESYACVQGAALGVGVQAVQPTEVLFLNARRLLTTCSSACAFHARLVRNLLFLVASKNLQMNEKLAHVTQRSTREKLLSYLSAESMKQGVSSFDIPFNRQQLADYLSVDRSAMSGELCRMRDEGLLQFDKNHFSLSDGSMASAERTGRVE